MGDMKEYFQSVPDWLKLTIVLIGYTFYSGWWLNGLSNDVARNAELTTETKQLISEYIREDSKIVGNIQRAIVENKTKIDTLEQQTTEQWYSIKALNSSSIKCDSLITELLKHINIVRERNNN